MSSTAPRVDASFGERLRTRTPVAYEHGLSGDPRLGLDAIARLAEELGPDSISAEKAAKPMVSDDAGAQNAIAVESIADQVRSLAANDSWFTLLNIEQSPAYAALVDEVLDGLSPTPAS